MTTAATPLDRPATRDPRLASGPTGEPGRDAAADEGSGEAAASTALVAPAGRSHLVEAYFDGACPFCVREVAFLRRLDRRGRIRFTDIAAAGFDPAAAGVPYADLMARIHARLPDGSMVTGVEVFRRLYAAVGFGPLAALTRLPGVSHALDAAYAWFARNRLRLGGRCEDGRCAVPDHGHGHGQA